MPLPIDSVLPEIQSAISDNPSVVVQAPPGAGKTTKIPLALLDLPFLEGKSVLMLEPRRLAAVNAARWMSQTIGENVGNTVGYTVRFQRKVSSATRIEVLTEGLLVRRLQSDSTLAGVGLVIFDEFHERSIHADTALALCLDIQQNLRDDLRIIVMSATLDAGPVARLLGNPPVISSEGRSFPVEVKYVGKPGRDLPKAVAETVYRAIMESEGDILAFLPGAGEIIRCHNYLQEYSAFRNILTFQLYGDLPFEEQERAILPGSKRKVVLATSIAESSLTIEGVKVVVDCGLTRRMRYESSSGLNRLVTEKVSRASAEQRAGRAGRLSPGICYRLWDNYTQQTLLPHTSPEIVSVDLCELALNLSLWGVIDVSQLSWVDIPPASSLAEARGILVSLGAIDKQFRITRLGRSISEFPLHPRLAKMILTGAEMGKGAMACDLAAIIGERDILINPGYDSKFVNDCDYAHRLEILESWRVGKNADNAVDTNACRNVDKASAQLKKLISPKSLENGFSRQDVSVLLATAYPERVARQRESGSDRYLLANGKGARLGRRTALNNQAYIVAVAMDAGESGDGVIHGATAIDLHIIEKLFADHIISNKKVEWDWSAGRLISCDEELFGAIMLNSRTCTFSGEDAAQAIISAIIKTNDLSRLTWTNSARQFQARVNLLCRLLPEEGWPDFKDENLISTISDWLKPYLFNVTSSAALAKIDLLTILQGQMSWDQIKRLNENVPTHILVPSGSRIPLDYLPESGPVLSVKLQELFGLRETPIIVSGKLPVLIHLLSPAGRPIQVTRDLTNFWDTIYPQVKKELKGRYPKHPWPDDPWNALPTAKTNRSMAKAIKS